MKIRRRFSAEFKAKVALDALSGELTLSELASKYNVHPNIITKWKKQARQGVVESFAGKAQVSANNHESEVRDLHAKIGQLTVENDFLQKAFARR
jgi:transposase